MSNNYTGSLESEVEGPPFPGGDSSLDQVQRDTGHLVQLDESAPERSSTDITAIGTVIVEGVKNSVSEF